MLVSSPHPVLLAVLEPDLDPFGERLSPGFHSPNTVGPDLQHPGKTCHPGSNF